MTKRGFHESAQRTTFPREVGRGMPLKAAVGTQRQGLTGDSEVTSNHTVLGILGGILVSTLVLGFQRSLCFTGVNTKDHGAQSWYAPCTVDHTAVTSTGEKRACEDSWTTERVYEKAMRKSLAWESGRLLGVVSGHCRAMPRVVSVSLISLMPGTRPLQ